MEEIPEDLLNCKLIRFKVKDNRRFLTVESYSTLGSHSGVDPENSVPVRIAKVDGRIFKIEVAGPLAPGEYALIFEKRPGTYEVYDFRIL